MEVKLRIPDQVYKGDPEFQRYFEAVQMMVNRMAVSYYKYGKIAEKKQGIDDALSGRQRLCMYDGKGPRPKGRPVNTGNTENLLDAANFFILEHLWPKHKNANFQPQTSAESPGLAYKK